MLCEAQDYVKLSFLLFGLSYIYPPLINNLLHIMEAFWKGLSAIVKHRASAMEEVF